MTRLNVNDARCVALFASGLQPTDAPAAEALAEVIRRTVRRFGIAGCASRMAQEFGDHPEDAVRRMRWIRQLAIQKPALAGQLPERPGSWSAVRVPAGVPCSQQPAVPTMPPDRSGSGRQRVVIPPSGPPQPLPAG